jgi:hypothetical protein
MATFINVSVRTSNPEDDSEKGETGFCALPPPTDPSEHLLM